MLRRIFTVGGFTLLSRLTGFARDIMLAAILGAGPVAEGGLPVSEKLSDDVISLPMHAYLDEPTQERIIKAVRDTLGAN